MQQNKLCDYCVSREACSFLLSEGDESRCSEFAVDPTTATKEGWRGLAGLLMVEAEAKGKLQQGDLAQMMFSSTFPAEEAATPFGDWLAKLPRDQDSRVMAISWERICHLLEDRIAS